MSYPETVFCVLVKGAQSAVFYVPGFSFLYEVSALSVMVGDGVEITCFANRDRGPVWTMGLCWKWRSAKKNRVERAILPPPPSETATTTGSEPTGYPQPVTPEQYPLIGG